jgi:hypothetical protein
MEKIEWERTNRDGVAVKPFEPANPQSTLWTAQWYLIAYQTKYSPIPLNPLVDLDTLLAHRPKPALHSLIR